jgi:glutathione synthase/RimK-type ligase-like ATP-grasp enzyme
MLDHRTGTRFAAAAAEESTMVDLAIYYEHPAWFEPLFRVLDRRGISWAPLPIQEHIFDPGVLAAPAPVIFNRLAMSSFLRQSEHAIYYSLAAIAHWELAGARVINGSAALNIDISKARQVSLFVSLGLAVPNTVAVHRREDLRRAAEQIGFPLILKPNVGGSGSGVTRCDSRLELDALVAAGATPVGVDGVTLVQEYVPARAARVIRCETLNGKFLYAIALNGAGSTFDLCPADVCMVDKPTITIEAFDPPPDIIQAVESVAGAAALDIGGIEYMIDDRSGVAKFYDINGLSNFVAQPMSVLGWDPHERLADYLTAVIGARRRAA